MPTKCQLGSIISHGSEGVVYSGSWCGRPAAIKVFPKNYAYRAEADVKIVTNLNHVNIIKYFGMEYEQGSAYLGMEYITGGNLCEFIGKQFTSSSYWTIICQILADVARGMIYLHTRNIAQGDLKSHNILLRTDTYQAVICDFGISRVVENETGTKKRNQTAKGTIRWMAPEICAPPPEQSSFASDVWSYGCIILEATSGRDPWLDQFQDDSILFRALQRKESAPVFTQICTNQSGPSHIRKLLLECCSWSKASRPRFIDILSRFETVHDESAFMDENLDQMSIDSTHFDEDHIKDYERNSFDENDNVEIQPIRSLENDYVPKSNISKGRLTGEIFTSKGSASGRAIYEGPQGGRYYLTAGGSKVYLHK
ncbi:unnamed protein product [Rotaria socialis]|uniref:Protein kinase domain-containing protein n=1 Tax=Rotaria socialis TaxID=392032 RepID=A0A817R1J9_9BILA|nr:unnamed protein product [Rotaria socialis]CAF3293888.1 unnamed protein product [Rotaria socialis]CAF4303263.1 unnamed protein product [Rotaria socialis]CAF4395986.1 unnamed protein product [Rotaria socialis]